MQSVVAAAFAFVTLLAWQRLVARAFAGRALGRAVARRLLFFVPGLVAVLFWPNAPVAVVPWVVTLVVCIAGVALLWLTALSNLRGAFELAATGLAPQTRTGALLIGLSLAGGPLVQEPIYRAMLLWPINDALGPFLAITLTTAMFVGEHRAFPGATARQFSRADYARQALAGALLAWGSIASGNVFVPMAAHALFNTPPLLVQVARVRGAAGDSSPLAA